MKPITGEWVKKAENDFKVARQILRRRKDIVPDAACFFCQQCVEKYLKAWLTESGIPFPRTHDLLVLLNLCLPGQPLWSAFAKSADTLSDYAVNFRYPGESATLSEAKKSLKHCKAIRKEIRIHLSLSA
jgi:HEPN domain-containing protein